MLIPHGVNTDFWRNLPSPPKLQICAVGRYLRNFQMLLRVARILLDRHPDLNFCWVVNPDHKLTPALASLLPPERFQVLRNLSAEDLHRLYAESWLFCTPYDNVVASNAIVEAMASGTPIFTTRVGGMSSYDGTRVLPWWKTTMMPPWSTPLRAVLRHPNCDCNLPRGDASMP